MKGQRSPLLIGLAAAAVLFAVVFPFVRWIATVWTDYLWYVDLGQQSVFVTRFVSQLTVGLLFAATTFLILYANMRIARSMAPRAVPVSLPDGAPVQLIEWVRMWQKRMGPWLDRAILLSALWFAFINGTSMASQWTVFRIAIQGGTFSVADPQFGRDVGFFVFRMPALEAINSWLFGILILATLLTVVVHIIDGAIRPWERARGFAPHVKAHLSVLFALLVLSRAFSYWLSIWNLAYSARGGQVTGPSYTDVHAQLPAYQILIVISVITAILLLFNIRYRGWRLPIIALGLWMGAAILLGGVWPALVQRWVVTPNEFAREAPYIQRNITMTRRAYDLEDVEGQPFPATEDLTASDVVAASDTLQNVRLWDPDIVKDVYAQLQTIRPYYDFRDVDVDRYTIGGVQRQVLVSAREMNSAALTEQAQTWQNRHLVYTHGFGLVMSPTSEADSRGLPRFVIGDIPPKVGASAGTTGVADLEISEPRIYFGEDTKEYALVGPEIREFDYPQGEKNAYYQYKSDRGAPIGSLVQRIAWAIRLGSSQVLLSDYVTPDTRVLLRRDLDTRLAALAPFLTFEDDPYPVLTDGKIVWVIDAYTRTSRYPNSEPLADGTNYLRNSVKVTVDAFTGETKFYAFDPDPIVEAWSKVFPSLFTPGEQIPDGVRDHFRYPQGLFVAQAEIYRTYHMTDVGVFYNKEDQWEIPGQRQGREMEPFFVLLRVPGETEEHFYLFQPYTPRNRDNMIGWIAASGDPSNFGERTVYLFPKERVIFGPEQISARINQDPVISPQLTLWNQRGSSVLFGNMVVIPIEDSIIYVQPLFLQSETTAIPELTRVVVAYSDRVEMERTLEAGLLKIFGQETPSTPTTGTAGPGGKGGQVAASAAEAQRLYDQAIAAQKKGDWAGYGRAIEQLGQVLQRLATTSTATP